MGNLLQAATACFVVGLVLNGQAHGQQFDIGQPILPLNDQSAMICEAGDLLGIGGQTHSDANDPLAASIPNNRQILIELVTRVDVNRDRKLGYRELQTLDRATRRQLLDQFDKNLDRKLSAQELEQETAPDQPAQINYPYEGPYAEEPLPAAPALPAKFRNLRRFGIGNQQTPQPPRSKPFARAATFGTSPNFTRPKVTKQSIDRRSGGGGCRASASAYLRVNSPR